jgi:hypothetical protein
MSILENPLNRLLGVVEKVVKELREDYTRSRASGIIGAREGVYREYYEVRETPPAPQTRPVIFVDAGFHVLETDVLILMLVNVGGVVRGLEGRLLYPPHIGDYEPTDALILYGRWSEAESDERFKLRVVPISERPLLYNDEKAEKVSNELTRLINERSRRVVSSVKRLRLYRRLVKYLEQLIEVAYALKLQDRVGVHSLAFVDGTLVRWFSTRAGLVHFEFDGLDMLEVLTGLDKATLKRRLKSVYGLVKQTKITSIARARWLFSSRPPSPLGMYTTTNPERARRAADKINSVKESYGDEAARETVNLFNRFVHPRSGVWASRFPITTDSISVLHLEVHLDSPIIAYEPRVGAYALEKATSEVAERVPRVVEELMACRSSINWRPPYGFMEVDEKVRIPTRLLHRLEDLFIAMLRRETGVVGHPLEYLFDLTRKMRLGYRG